MTRIIRANVKRVGEEQVRLICWNVNKRVRAGLARQIEEIERRQPDIVGLQEITPTNSDGWLEGLAAIGLRYGVSSLDLLPAARAQRRPAAAVCCWRVAGRCGSAALGRWSAGVPRAAGLRADRGARRRGRGPRGARADERPDAQLGLRWAKAETYEAIYAQLARPTPSAEDLVRRPQRATGRAGGRDGAARGVRTSGRRPASCCCWWDWPRTAWSTCSDRCTATPTGRRAGTD